MNKYKITYVVGEGQTEESYITERTEKAARKVFKEQSGGREVVDVELYETDAIATKQQERDTLAKIRDMVAELGPQSYIKTAFKGSFEDAEQNIEDDAAYSWYDRAELAEEKVKKLEGRVKELEGGVEELIQKDEERKAAIERLEAERDELKKRILPEWLYNAIYTFVNDELAETRTRMEELADKMAYSSDNPACVLFRNSLAAYKVRQERRDTCQQIIGALDDLKPESEGEGATA